MPDATQDFTAKKTYRNDWTAHLATVGRTITAATVTVTSPAAVTGTTFTSTGVYFKLDTTAVPTTAPTSSIVLTVTVTLDNSDIDARHYTIQVTNT